MDIMQPINTLCYQTGDKEVCVPANTTVGVNVNYFTCTQQDAVGAGSLFPGTRTIPTFQQILSKVDTTAGVYGYQFLYGGCRISHSATNQSNSQCIVTAYYCRARRDLSSSSAPIEDLNQGFFVSGIPLIQQDSVQITPFQSPNFCSSYRILRVKTIKLDAGQSHTWNVVDKKKHMVKMQQFVEPVNLTANITNVPITFAQAKGNKFILFRIHGVPTNDVTTKSQIGVTTPTLDILSKFSWNFKWVDDMTRTVFPTNAIGITTLTVGPSIMTDETALVAAQTTA